MSDAALIACASSKRDRPAPALELYDSTLFNLSVRYAEQRGVGSIYVLSAKYGLVEADRVIAPYDRSLNDMRVGEVREWAAGVVEELKRRYDLRRDRFVVLAGKRYRRFILPHLDNYDVPLEGLGIGKQLQFLKAAVEEEGD